MEKISFVEFKEFPKKEVNKQKLQPGKKYYIQDTSRRSDKFTTVFEGMFTQKNGDFNQFSNVNFVVNPFNQVGKPFGFNNKKGFKFMEVIDFEPTEFEKYNKKTTINELNQFISEKKAEPHIKTPTISFFGTDYRKATKRFNNRVTLKKPTSSKINRISSPSNSKSKSRSSKKNTSSSKKSSRSSSRKRTTSSNKNVYI